MIVKLRVINKPKEVSSKHTVAVKKLTLHADKKTSAPKSAKKVVKFDPKKIDPQDGREQCCKIYFIEFNYNILAYCHRWFNNDRIEKHEDA